MDIKYARASALLFIGIEKNANARSALGRAKYLPEKLKSIIVAGGLANTMQMDIKSASKGAKSGERAIIEDDSIAQQRRRRGRRWTMFRRRNYSRNCSRNSRNPLCPGSSPVNNSSTAIRDEPIKSFVIDQPIC